MNSQKRLRKNVFNEVIKDNCNNLQLLPMTLPDFLRTEQKIQKNFLNFLDNMPYLQKGSIFGNFSYKKRYRNRRITIAKEFKQG